MLKVGFPRTSGELRGLAIAAIFSLLLPGVSHAERPLPGSPSIERDSRTGTGCKAIVADIGPTAGARTGHVELRWCGEKLHHEVLIYDPHGGLISAAVCCPGLGVKVTLAVLPDPQGESDLVIATSGLDPLDDEENFSVEIFHAESGRRIGEIWSQSPPDFLGLDAERDTAEIVVTRDIFAIGQPDAPVWPVVVKVSRGVVLVPLGDRLHVLRSTLVESRGTFEKWKRTCGAFDSMPCPLDTASRRLEAQINALEALVGALPRSR